jgi:hypothetical protein
MSLPSCKQWHAAAVFLAFICACALAAAETYDSLIAQAAQALTAKQYSRSADFAERAIALNPARLEAYLYAAKGYDAQRLFDDEIGMLQQALIHAPAEKKQLIRDAIAQARKATGAGIGQSSTAAATPAASAPTQAEIVLWKSIENSQNPQDLGAYLRSYPNGAFVPLARQRLANIEAGIRSQQEQLLAAQQRREAELRGRQEQVAEAKKSIAANILRLEGLLNGDEPLVLNNSSEHATLTSVLHLDAFDGCAITLTQVSTERAEGWVSEERYTDTIPLGSLYFLMGQMANYSPKRPDGELNYKGADGSPYYLLNVYTRSDDIKITYTEKSSGTGRGGITTRKDRAGKRITLSLRDKNEGDQVVRIIRDIGVGCQGKLPPFTDEPGYVVF